MRLGRKDGRMEGRKEEATMREREREFIMLIQLL
jgi:hypothetical protein